jgi:hypothetical protein
VQRNSPKLFSLPNTATISEFEQIFFKEGHFECLRECLCDGV